ncbi:indolepyruvate ferredoxin oxidoreductase family protein [Salinarimonas sp.]|uniref:indolepyruvate ferredoxin oxidoreductase family protein n=1 Tax=Salinarimonas sp. TaxID=2766526 RepID=UPI00391AE55C
MSAVTPAEFDTAYRLEDRYARESGRVYMTGTQALVRIVLEQARADREAGLDTAGFVSGYRGSPLGGVDQEMWRARRALEAARIRFQPAINEDLAATAILGTQKVESDPNRAVAGVFALWYGKGPGVDRAGDALKHGNAYGSSPHGGVLVVVGDDHGCVSSSMSHQSDLALMAWQMPVIHPASISDYVSFGLWGYAASRFSGAWVGFKAISEVVEGAASLALPERRAFVAPEGFDPGPTGLHYRWPDLPSPRIEERAFAKLGALRAFARANPLDRLVVAPERPRLLVLTIGKAHGDAMEALRIGGLPPARLAEAGIAVMKVGLVFPLDVERLCALAEGVEEILVVEEKAGVVERQLKDALFNLPADRRPRIVGKTDETGAPLISETQELRPSRIAAAIAARLSRIGVPLALPQATRREAKAGEVKAPVRTPYFCSGCPHNTSTRVPEGSTAQAGIGCHFMANWMDRATTGIVQMGGEGVDWTGQAPFTKTGHVFQNLGDGTYFHSGHVAIRQAIAAGANITYKILYNDAVAMTGGQPVDGTLSVPQITRLVAGEGVSRIAVVSDDPERFDGRDAFAPGVSLHHRDDLDAVQRELRDVPGVSVLVYDQTCAAEKRRRRKKGLHADPDRRLVINDLVCEGCGDCQAKSNCLSVVPVETEFGRKRTIDQHSCNKDYSCVKGFCPSFVSVEGGKLRRGVGANVAAAEVLAKAAALPAPLRLASAEPFEILVAGVGGTGVVTVGALITMAAHLEGRGASVLDFMGFAQKGGQVLSFVRLAETPAALNQVRIDVGRANAVIACDLVVAASEQSLGTMAPGRTRIVANTREIPTGAMLRDPSAKIDTGALARLVEKRVGEGALAAFDAQAYAERLIGDAQQTNILLLGFAWQKGLVPVSAAALERAIELNGVAIEANKLAFAWGRIAAADAAFVAPHLEEPGREPIAKDLDTIVARRVAFLTDYQDAAYAARYAQIVARVREAEARAVPGASALAEAVAKNLFKLMAYKDEYEVARLYTDGAFLRRIAREFEGEVRLSFHLAPPFLARPRPGESEPRKMTFGPWMLGAFRMLAKLKRLRGTALDPFGYAHERRTERALIGEYEALLEEILSRLDRDRHAAAVALASIPDKIRGFGPVKARNLAAAKAQEAALLERFRAGDAPVFREAAE